MFVRLAQISSPSKLYLEEIEREQDLLAGTLVNESNPETLLVHIARVSSNRPNTFKDTEGLIAYLIRNYHWSPFEHTFITMEVTTSRAIGRQILRHRSFTFQEFSQRYAAVAEIESFEMRGKAEQNRQSSTDILFTVFPPRKNTDTSVLLLGVNKALQTESNLEDLQFGYHGLIGLAQRLYTRALEMGGAKETARFILPEATQTKIYMTGSLRSWIHYLGLRTDEHAQKEARDIAYMQYDLLYQYFPTTFRACIKEGVLQDLKL